MAYSTKNYLSRLSTQYQTRGQSLSPQRQQTFYLAALLVIDVIMLKLAFALSHWIRFSSGLDHIFDAGMVAPERYALFSLVFIGFWIILFALFRAYDWDNLLGGTQEYALVAHASTFATVGVMVSNFLWPFVIARGWLLLAWVLTFFFVAVGRFTLRHIAYRLRTYGYFVVPALIVGNNDEGQALADQLTTWRTSGLNIVGIVDDQIDKESQEDDIPMLGDLAALPEIVEQYRVEELILTTSALTSQQILEIFRRYSDSPRINVRLSSGLFDVITTGLQVKSLGYVPLISVDKFRLSPVEEFMKNCLDRVGAFVALLMLSPLLIGVALAVGFTSPGPIIYRRRVLGQGNTEFDAFKFRTMYIDGDELLTAEQASILRETHKLKHDPRITPIGRVLRKYSIDELPQLLNVLRGEMSLIGPRMITPMEKKKYGKWDLNLLTVKPGLSGLWQVSGRSDLSYEERVQLDMHYIRNYTIWLDLHLCIQTIRATIMGRGAY